MGWQAEWFGVLICLCLVVHGVAFAKLCICLHITLCCMRRGIKRSAKGRWRENMGDEDSCSMRVGEFRRQSCQAIGGNLEVLSSSLSVWIKPHGLVSSCLVVWMD